MKYALVLMAVLLSACSSMSQKTEDLKANNKCTVWKEGVLGSKTVVEVEGEVAKQKQTCWVMNMWGCSYTDYQFKDGSTDIVSSLPPKDKAIANLNGAMLSIDMTGAKVEPFELKADHADYEVKGLMGPKQNMHVEYNQICSKRQAALGLMTMVTK